MQRFIRIEKWYIKRTGRKYTKILTVIWDEKNDNFKAFLCGFPHFLPKKKVLFYDGKKIKWLKFL